MDFSSEEVAKTLHSQAVYKEVADDVEITARVRESLEYEFTDSTNVGSNSEVDSVGEVGYRVDDGSDDDGDEALPPGTATTPAGHPPCLEEMADEEDGECQNHSIGEVGSQGEVGRGQPAPHFSV